MLVVQYLAAPVWMPNILGQVTKPKLLSDAFIGVLDKKHLSIKKCLHEFVCTMVHWCVQKYADFRTSEMTNFRNVTLVTEAESPSIFKAVFS